MDPLAWISANVVSLKSSACLLPCLCFLLAGSEQNPKIRKSLSIEPSVLQKRSAKVDALFAPWSQGRMPGAAVLVLLDGKVLHKKGYGLADLDPKNPVPIGPQTSFRLASMTKQFTAMAIMMLAERGALHYDDPLYKFFPEFRGTARTITVEQLLHHTSGLLDYEDLFNKDGSVKNDPSAGAAKPAKKCEPTSCATLQLLARQTSLMFLPGEDYHYSNSGYVVLGQIIRKVSRKSYREFIEQDIFHNLGMTNSLVYDETRPKIPNCAKSYSWENGKYKNIDESPFNLIVGEDGIYTTIENLAKWDQALWYTDKLVKPFSLQQAFTRGQLNNGNQTDYGFGWIVGSNYVWHNGWWLGFRTDIHRYLQHTLTVIVLSNCNELNETDMAERVADIYLDKD